MRTAVVPVLLLAMQAATPTFAEALPSKAAAPDVPVGRVALLRELELAFVPKKSVFSLVRGAIQNQWRAKLTADASIENFVKDCPQMIDVAVRAAQTRASEDLYSSFAKIDQEFDAHWSPSLTNSELKSAVDFYVTPAVRALAAMDVQRIEGDTSIQAARRVAAPIRDSFSPSDLVRRAQFERSLTGQKLLRLGNEWTKYIQGRATTIGQETMQHAVGAGYAAMAAYLGPEQKCPVSPAGRIVPQPPIGS